MDRLIKVKNIIFPAAAFFGSVFGNMLGGFNKMLVAYLGAMVVDYISGMIVAIVFKNSPKTETGAAQSQAGIVGLIKKVYILMLIMVVNQIDIVLGSNGVLRNGVVLGFFSLECVSLVENAGLMGIKLPAAMTNAIDILKQKSDGNKVGE